MGLANEMDGAKKPTQRRTDALRASSTACLSLARLWHVPATRRLTRLETGSPN